MRSFVLVASAAVFSSTARAASFTLSLKGYESLDIVESIDKAALDLDWKVKFDGKVGDGPKLLVEGPVDLQDASLGADSRAGRKAGAAVTLKYACKISSKTQTSGSNASGATRSTAWIPLAIIAFFAAMLHKVHRAALATVVVLAIATLSYQGKGAWACGGKTTLTLVLEPEQWGKVYTCGVCQASDIDRTRYFIWRPPCDFQKAAEELNKVASACLPASSPAPAPAPPPGDDCDKMPLGDCDTEGWCKLTQGSKCSLSSAMEKNCLNPSLQKKLVDKTNATGTDFLNKIFYCIRARMPVMGRPYTTSEGRLRAVGEWGDAECPWSASVNQSQATTELASMALAFPDGWTKQEAAQAAHEWLEHGLEEHASIASFSRFSLDLLRFAAPPSLVAAAHVAAADEVRHAQLALNLAAHFRGQFQKEMPSKVAVGQFPFSSVNLSESLSVMASRTFEEGCIGESSASAGLALSLHALKSDSPARSTVAELLRDEARHAALAWATVHWAVRGGAIVAVPEREAMNEHTLEFDASAAPLSMMWGGKVPAQTSADLDEIVGDVWIRPWIAAIHRGEVPTPTLRVSSGDLGEAVSEAAMLVHKEFVKLTNHESSAIV